MRFALNDLTGNNRPCSRVLHPLPDDIRLFFFFFFWSNQQIVYVTMGIHIVLLVQGQGIAPQVEE